MSDLANVDQLKRELKLPLDSTAEDDVLQRKLDDATELVLDYVGQRLGDTAEDWAETVAAWTEDTAPKAVIAAVLDLSVALYRFRGDDVEGPKWLEEGHLPPSVRMKLDRLRDPVIA